MTFADRKLWILGGGAVVLLSALWLFGSNDPDPVAQASPRTQPRRMAAARNGTPGPASIEPIHLEWLQPSTGSYRSRRNLFDYVEPPPPPPPPPPQPAPPPPDRDGDGVPDFQDNCPDVANPDQSDIDRDGVGTACETEPEKVPPPPPPQPPAFRYKFIGTFGPPEAPIAVFTADGELLNVRRGETFGGKFVLLNIGIESVDIGFVGFPPDVRRRIPVGG